LQVLLLLLDLLQQLFIALGSFFLQHALLTVLAFAQEFALTGMAKKQSSQKENNM
jgi:hypothetical protein